MNDNLLYDAEHFPDNFYLGIIARLEPGRARGVVRSDSGREIPFEFPFVTVVGAPLGGHAPGLEMLKQGARVGFDLGRTSKGLRVTKIRIA